MAAQWTPEKDAKLVEMRRASPPKTWRVVTLSLGMSKTECQRHFEWLTEGRDKAQPVKVATDEPARRDGLDWLIAKKRLTPGQRRAAAYFRAACREAVGVSLKSGLDMEVRGSGSGGLPLELPIGALDAQRRLDVMRQGVLRGQTDMLTVVDGVCDKGTTLRELAKDDDRRAGQLEAVLKVALDLLAKHLEPEPRKAAA